MIVLLRAEARNDPYRAVSTSFVPLFATTLLPPTLLTAQSHYSAVVVTSQRAIHAIRSIDLHASWRDCLWFCVGPTTEERLRDLGVAVLGLGGKECQSAAELVEYINNYYSGLDSKPIGNDSERQIFKKKMLHLTGDKTLGTIQNALEVDCLQVYETNAIEDTVLLQQLNDIALGSSLVFFSPSGVNLVYGLLGRKLQEMNCVAIGKTTLAALEMHGLSARMASSPTPAGLLSAFL